MSQDVTETSSQSPNGDVPTPTSTRSPDQPPRALADSLRALPGRMVDAVAHAVRPPDFPGSAWQVRARVRIEELRRELTTLGARPHGAGLVPELQELLTEAESVLTGGGPKEWVSGGRIEYAWQTVHAVERAMVALRTPEELAGQVPGFLASAARYLPKEHQAVAAFDGRNGGGGVNESTLKARVVTLMEAYHGASDEFHESARRLRNRMLGISVVALVFAVLLVVLQWRTKSLKLIAEPANVTGVEPWRLLLFVMVAGALGAFISAVPLMIKSRSGGIPYKLPFQQSLLKLALGPLVAVGGIMLVLGGLADVAVGSLPALLGVALVFGAGQQFVTGFADRRASELLKEANKA